MDSLSTNKMDSFTNITVKPFDELLPATMTMVAPITGKVKLMEIFSLFRVPKINLALPQRQPKKFKIPHYKVPGVIISSRFMGMTRGIVRSTTSRFFKNSITIDLSLKDKNVSIKLAAEKIHLTGIKMDCQAKEACQYLTDQINEIQDDLDYMNNEGNAEKLKQTVAWVLKEIKGAPVKRKELVNIDGSKCKSKFMIRNYVDDYGIIVPDIDKSPDSRIASLLIRMIGDYVYYNDFIHEVEWTSQIKRVCESRVGFDRILKGMVNINYSLGFRVNRSQLANVINNAEEGFQATFDNLLMHNVTIYLPYEVPEEYKEFRKKNDNPHHSIFVNKTGVIMQSGPGDESMRSAYYSFLHIIDRFKSEISQDEGDSDSSHSSGTPSPCSQGDRLIEVENNKDEPHFHYPPRLF